MNMQAWWPETLLELFLTHAFFCEIWKMFKSSCFEEHLQTTGFTFSEMYLLTLGEEVKFSLANAQAL